ncbi:MAG: esterase-like activity of phytase family protein, partial [Woeseiaceae bacterium]|nr:esterase-like activity of phytase family protein [Woeseiaceae bacterium]
MRLPINMKQHLLPAIALGFVLTGCQPEPVETSADNSASMFGPREDYDPIRVEAPRYPATLAGRAVLPYESRLTLPADLPEEMRISGKYTHPGIPILETIGEYPGVSFGSDPSAPRYTGVSFPIGGQPLQGFSGITALGDGTYIVTLDNGFGTKGNSRDAILAFVTLRFDWEAGEVEILDESFLHDPDNILPFEIVNEDTEERYLTGGDLDPESIQAIGDDVYIGEEFGPFLLRTDRDGRVTGFFEARLGDDTIRSKADNPLPEGENSRQLHRSSRGFEGMAASPDGRYLYLLLEGPLVVPDREMPEMVDEGMVLRMLKFDVDEGRFVDENYRYILERPGTAIGGFNFINEHDALIIERDSGEGDEALICTDGISADCFNFPALFKRVYRVSFDGVKSGGIIQKTGYIDLLDIADGDETFTMPFVTIENVVRADET